MIFTGHISGTEASGGSDDNAFVCWSPSFCRQMLELVGLVGGRSIIISVTEGSDDELSVFPVPNAENGDVSS